MKAFLASLKAKLAPELAWATKHVVVSCLIITVGLLVVIALARAL